MAQVSYGTITITDTNDVESIIVEYNRNQSTTTPPAQTDSGWSTNRPAWEQGYYIWQRTRTHRSGTQANEDTLGNAVCITGSAGQNGTSITISSIKYAISTTESQPADSSFTYTSVPTVAEGSWLWTLTTYNNGNKMYTKSKQGTSGTSVTVSSVKYAISEENTITDESVYSFRKTGDGKGVDNKEEDVLVGGSLVWNQLIQNGNFADTSKWTTNSYISSFTVANNIGTITCNSGGNAIISPANVQFYANHKYLTVVQVKPSHSRVSVLLSTPFTATEPRAQSTTAWTQLSIIGYRTSDYYGSYPRILVYNTENGDTVQIRKFICIDLTTLFGNSTIADYVYSLEQSTAGAGIAWLRKYFPKIFEWHEYDAGTMVHVSGLQGHKMVGFNQFDEKWEAGRFNATTGEKTATDSWSRCVDYITVIPSTRYYYNIGGIDSTYYAYIFYYNENKEHITHEQILSSVEKVTPSNCRYICIQYKRTIEDVVNYQVCINLSDPSRNGQYEPYEKHSYPLDSTITLRGIPKLVDGKLVADGDWYEPSGKQTVRYGEVDLGTLDWTYDTTTLSVPVFRTSIENRAKGSSNFVCSKYSVFGTDRLSLNDHDKAIASWNNINETTIGIRDDSYTDAATFKSAMSGIYLVYEKITSTTLQAQSFSSPQICYPDGTEEYVSTSIVPVGHNTTYFLGTTTQPADSEFTYDNPPNVQDGQWLWARTIYSDNSKTYLKTRQGFSGESGRSLSDTITEYTTAASSANITEDNMNNYTWSENVPNYSSSTPAYWVRVTNRYSNPVTVEHIIYKDNGITDAMATAAAANSTANQANTTANQANQTANSANQTANQANTNVTNLQTKLKYYWTNEVAHTNGSGGWTKPNYPAGTYAASGISGTTFDYENSLTYGYNTLYANGIKLRYNAINLGELTGSSLIFYKPSTTSQGGKAMELSGSALKFYNPTNDSISMMDLTSSGLTFKTAAGATIGTFGSDASGGLLDLSGRLNIKGGGRIGQDSDNYWEFGDNKSYNDEDSAYLMGKGTASIQLGETGHWRLDRNRIHTGWYQLSDSTAGTIHFDTGMDNGTTYYWDYGLHYPNKSGNGNNKFLYVRRSSSSTSTSLATMKSRIDDDSWWVYKFYVDGDGNIHAKNFFVGDSDTPIGGGTGTIAEKIINSDSTYGKGSTTQPIYIDSNGRPATTTYALNAAGAKGVDTNFNNTSSTNLPTTAAVVSYVTSRGYKTTDENVQTSQANDKKIYLTGTQTTGTTTGKLNFDSNIYITTTAGTLHATTFEGNLSGTATKANQDGDGNVIKTTYLKLSGGQVTGPVSFGDSVSMDGATVGNLIVNGNASFTNNISVNTINGVTVGSSPKFTDTTYTFASGTNKFTVTPSGGTAQTVTVTPSITNNVTGSGTNGYLAKFTGANTIGNGPQLGSATTTYLRNDGTWATPPGTYSLPLAANGTRGGVQIGYTQSGKNYPVQLSSEKMYVNVPWTDTTYTVATGDSNGQIKVTPSSGSAYNVSVKGLGSAAFVNTSLFPIVSTYTLAAGKAVRIQYPTQVPVLISAQRSNGGGRLILLGGGYGSEGTVRNDFQELVNSNPNVFTWTLPSSSSISNSIEIMNVFTTGTATITVWSSAAPTFTEIDALSDTAMNRTIITSANYTDYTVTKTGTGASGNWGINVTGTAVNVTGTVAIDHGGTGKTTANDAINALLSGLPTWSANPTDTTYFIRQDTAGSATYGKVPASTIWSYISGKLPSWSKASSKPSYSYSEIGGAPDAIVDATVNEQGVIVLTKNGGDTIPLSTEIAVVESQGANKLVTAGTTTGINVGNAAEPVYFSAGVPVKGNAIPKLNNATTGGTFYAPTTAGTSGQVLTSSGGAPGWTNQSSLSVGSATKATQDSDGSVINTTYLKLSGGKMTGGLEISGHVNCGNGSASNLAWTQGGGGYHNAYNNIVLHGDATTGSSGIAFISDKGNTNINAPTDRAFIQFHAYGVTTKTGEGTNPTLATSGESNRLVIGVGNDVTDEVWLQTPATYGLRHQVGSSTYTIPSVASTTTTANYPVISTTSDGVHAYNTSVTMNGGTITAATFSGALSGNASTATEFSSAASVTLTGDTTGTASSKKGWSITTKTDRLSPVGDNRSVATTPNDYANKFIFQGLKYNNKIDSPVTGDTYSYLFGLRGWSDSSGGNAHELAFNGYGIFTRMGSTTTWDAWRKLLDSNNYTDYTVKKDGTGASGTWGISISGNAATATTATTATTANNLWAYAGNEVTIGANNSTAGASTNNTVYINYRDVYGGTTTNNATQLTTYYFGNRKGGVTGVTVYAETFSGNLSGNASSATNAKYLMNRGANTVTISDSAWNHGVTPTNHTNRETVWKQNWRQSGITYTPSGGSATTNTDSADLVYWLSSSNTGNALQVNMAIDGLIYALGGFKGNLDGNAATATNATNANNATTANRLAGFTSHSTSIGWGNQTGTPIMVMNDSTGGSVGFRRDNPASGQTSMVINGTVYIKEGGVNISDAIKSITRSGTTFTYTTLWGNTGTFTQQDSDTKNTAGSTDTSSEIYLIGATSQAANPQTYSHDTARVRSNGNFVGSGYEMATSNAMGTTKAAMHYDSTLEAIVFSFS